MFKKIIAVTMLISIMSPMAAAFAHPNDWYYYPGWYDRYRYRNHHHSGYHKDRIIGGIIIGAAAGAIITAKAKDRENDGINDKERCDKCGARHRVHKEAPKDTCKEKTEK